MSKPWRWVRVGDVLKTGSGGTPLKANKTYYEGGTIPWLMSGEVAQGQITEAKHFITQKGLDNSSAKIFPRDTVLIAMYGATAGEVGILRFESATNQAICGIWPHKDFLPKFLYYFFLSRKQDLIAQATGNAQPNISQIKIKNTLMPIVDIAEQAKIIVLLDKCHDAIESASGNTLANFRNAGELVSSHLREVFTHGCSEASRIGIATRRERSATSKKGPVGISDVTRTGGREASTRHIAGKLSLAVGMPEVQPKAGWRWSWLSDLARLESGHTPRSLGGRNLAPRW